jgi:hypothetical protein
LQVPEESFVLRTVLWSQSGLPDGFKPKSQFGYILGLGMDNVGIF